MQFDVDLETARRRRSLKWRHFGDDLIPMWVAEMDFPLAPPVAERLSGMVERGDFGYPAEAPATTEFGEAVAGWMSRRHGWEVDPALVSITSDTMKAIEIAIERFTDPGDPVALTDPVYYPFRVVIEDAGRTPLWVPMIRSGERWEVDVEALEAAFRRDRVRLFLHCNPHNPTGTMFTLAEQQAIADLAERHDVLVVSDEVHADLSFDTQHLPFATVRATAAERTITTSSASKAFNFPGLRCGYAIAGTRGLLGEIKRVPPRRRRMMSIAGYEATLAAYTEGDAWLDSACGHLRRMRDYTIERLRAIDPSIAPTRPAGTYLLWTDWRRLELEPHPAGFMIGKARVAMSPGDLFGPSGINYLRCNFATSIGILDEALDRIGTALAKRE